MKVKIRKPLFFNICLLLILSSCTKTSNDQHGEFEVIKIDSKLSANKLSQIVDTVLYVRLETTSNSLLGEVSKIKVHNNKLFILDRRVAQALFCFDMNGNFNFKIEKGGSKGPDQLLSLDDFDLNLFR